MKRIGSFKSTQLTGTPSRSQNANDEKLQTIMRDFGKSRSPLQAELARAILPEQASIADVAPDHLNRAMPRLVHDGAF